MKKDNKSSAQNFVITTTFPEESRKKYCEFIVNVNTSAEKKPPFFSLTSVCQIVSQDKMNSDNQQMETDEEDSDNYLLALKTETTIAIISQKRVTAKLIGTMDISDRFTSKKNICFHGFVYSKILETSQLASNISALESKSAASSQRQSVYSNAEQSPSSTNYTQSIPDNPDIYICISTGCILVMNSLTGHFLYNFNMKSEKGDDVWHPKKITKICTMPDQSSFLVLFSDSVFMQYSLNSKRENHQFQEEIMKQLDQVSFQPKKFGQSIQRKSYGTYQYSSICDKDFVGFACYHNDEDSFCGPHKFFKFKCPSISDFAILPLTHPLYKLVNGKYSRDPLLIAFSGLDGLFRVVDVINFQAVYCFKSYYGGINSFSFEKDNVYSPIVSLACQDDSIIILNTRLNSYTRIIGHNSFVSHSVFTPITQNIVRITAGSFDGQISVTELKRKEIDNPEKEDQNTESYLPIKVKFQNNIAETVNAAHIQKVNDQGIAHLQGFSDYFLTSSFDGCASIFKYQDQMPEGMNPNQNEGQGNQQEQYQDNQNRSSQYSQSSSSQQYQKSMRRESGGQSNNEQYKNESQYYAVRSKGSKGQSQQEHNNNNYSNKNNNNNNEMENEDNDNNQYDNRQKKYSNSSQRNQGQKMQNYNQQPEDDQHNYQKQDQQRRNTRPKD